MNTSPHQSPSPWWREGYMWLVVGGPAVVVVAGIATMILAYRNADPVVQQKPPVTARSTDSLEPALRARNAVSLHLAPVKSSSDR